MVRILVGVAALALLALFATALAPMLESAVGWVTILVTSSPMGWAIGLALILAGAVCVRTLALLRPRN